AGQVFIHTVSPFLRTSQGVRLTQGYPSGPGVPSPEWCRDHERVDSCPAAIISGDGRRRCAMPDQGRAELVKQKQQQFDAEFAENRLISPRGKAVLPIAA
ncbi:MAG: hypothetical protein AAGA94_12130, partial [Pseudomonadota bacterium]